MQKCRRVHFSFVPFFFFLSLSPFREVFRQSRGVSFFAPFPLLPPNNSSSTALFLDERDAGKAKGVRLEKAKARARLGYAPWMIAHKCVCTLCSCTAASLLPFLGLANSSLPSFFPSWLGPASPLWLTPTALGKASGNIKGPTGQAGAAFYDVAILKPAFRDFPAKIPGEKPQGRYPASPGVIMVP